MTEPVLIEDIVTDSPQPQRRRDFVDEVLLTSEQRIRAHGRARSVAGRDLIISLPRGAALDDGDLLEFGDEAIRVRAAVEDLLEIRPGDPKEAILAGYTIGNLHRPLRIHRELVLTPHDSAVAAALAAVGIRSASVRRPFVGERLTARHHHVDQ